MEHLCDYLEDNKTLSEYCTEYRLKYRMVLEYIESDADRTKMFALANKARTSRLEDEVLASLRNAASIDPRKFFDNSGRLVNVQDLPPEVANSITEISSLVDKEGDETVKIKYTPRHTANQDLGKHLGMFKDRLDLTTNGKELVQDVDNNTARRVAFLLEKAARKNAQGEQGASNG